MRKKHIHAIIKGCLKKKILHFQVFWTVYFAVCHILFRLLVQKGKNRSVQEEIYESPSLKNSSKIRDSNPESDNLKYELHFG